MVKRFVDPDAARLILPECRHRHRHNARKHGDQCAQKYRRPERHSSQAHPSRCTLAATPHWWLTSHFSIFSARNASLNDHIESALGYFSTMNYRQNLTSVKDRCARKSRRRMMTTLSSNESANWHGANMASPHCTTCPHMLSTQWNEAGKNLNVVWHLPQAIPNAPLCTSSFRWQPAHVFGVTTSGHVFVYGTRT